jgi:hypothetical protein
MVLALVSLSFLRHVFNSVKLIGATFSSVWNDEGKSLSECILRYLYSNITKQYIPSVSLLFMEESVRAISIRHRAEMAALHSQPRIPCAESQATNLQPLNRQGSTPLLDRSRNVASINLSPSNSNCSVN